MDNWVLENRILKLGNNRFENDVTFYNNTIASFVEYKQESQLVLVTSDDQQYAAVYDTVGHYCEFFQ
jgi:hypothetical protein